MKKIKLLIFISFILTGLSFLPKATHALDVTAASLSLADVQAAVNTVDASGGGNVYLPAGSVTWTSYLLLPGGVNLIGYGNPTWDNQNTYQTNIYWNYSGGTGIVVNFRFGTNHYERPLRIANLNFVGTYGGSGLIGSLIEMDSARDFRIDHCYFDRGNYMISIDDVTGKPSRGVFDHCFWDMTAYGHPAYGYCLSYVGADYDATLPKVWGTQNAVFVEDSYMKNCGAHTIGSFNGAKWVFRHNTTWEDVGWDSALDAHGPGFSGPRGAWGWEVYSNSFNSPPGQGTPNWCDMRMRSGDGVVWGNTVNHMRHLINITLDSSSCPSCTDAPGHGGNSVYVWGNTLNDVTEGEIYIEDANCTQSCEHIGTEIIQSAMPGYTPYTYPHPLRNEGSGDTTPPAAPSGVVIN